MEYYQFVSKLKKLFAQDVKILRLVRRHHKKAERTYRSSRECRTQMAKTIRDIKEDPCHNYVYLRDYLNILRAQARKRRKKNGDMDKTRDSNIDVEDESEACDIDDMDCTDNIQARQVDEYEEDGGETGRPAQLSVSSNHSDEELIPSEKPEELTSEIQELTDVDQLCSGDNVSVIDSDESSQKANCGDTRKASSNSMRKSILEKDERELFSGSTTEEEILLIEDKYEEKEDSSFASTSSNNDPSTPQDISFKRKSKRIGARKALDFGASPNKVILGMKENRNDVSTYPLPGHEETEHKKGDACIDLTVSPQGPKKKITTPVYEKLSTKIKVERKEERPMLPGTYSYKSPSKLGDVVKMIVGEKVNLSIPRSEAEICAPILRGNPVPLVVLNSLQKPKTKIPRQHGSSFAGIGCLPQNNVKQITSLKSESKATGAVGKKCLVCGDKASRFHYGVISCNSCRDFFTISINNPDPADFHCRHMNSCLITMETRRRCKCCRFAKCVAVGMQSTRTFLR